MLKAGLFFVAAHLDVGQRGIQPCDGGVVGGEVEAGEGRGGRGGGYARWGRRGGGGGGGNRIFARGGDRGAEDMAGMSRLLLVLQECRRCGASAFARCSVPRMRGRIGASGLLLCSRRRRSSSSSSSSKQQQQQAAASSSSSSNSSNSSSSSSSSSTAAAALITQHKQKHLCSQPNGSHFVLLCTETRFTHAPCPVGAGDVASTRFSDFCPFSGSFLNNRFPVSRFAPSTLGGVCGTAPDIETKSGQ